MKLKILLVLLVLGLLFSCGRNIDFDPDLWMDIESAEAGDDKKSLRQRMLPDALNLLEGSTRREIILKMGYGENTDYFRGMDWDLIYLLGPEESFISLDSQWLLLWFDDDDTFERYEIVTD